jgi:hypothetical protein
MDVIIVTKIKKDITKLKKTFMTILTDNEGTVILTSLKEDNQQYYYIFKLDAAPFTITLIEKKIPISKQEWYFIFDPQEQLFLNGKTCSKKMTAIFS